MPPVIVVDVVIPLFLTCAKVDLLHFMIVIEQIKLSKICWSNLYSTVRVVLQVTHNIHIKNKNRFVPYESQS